MSNTKIFAAVIVLAVIAAGASLLLAKQAKVSSSAGSIEYKPHEEVTIRYLSSSTIVEPYELAKELGYLKGINITRAGSYTGGPEDIIAVASGSTNIGHSAWISIINAKARGTEIKAFAAPMGNSPESWYEGTPYLSKWIVLENSSIRIAKDLMGKKIAAIQSVPM